MKISRIMDSQIMAILKQNEAGATGWLLIDYKKSTPQFSLTYALSIHLDFVTASAKNLHTSRQVHILPSNLVFLLHK